MAKQEKPGCLSVIIGYWILFYIIYLPIYFFIFNNQIDAVKEASLETLVIGPYEVLRKHDPYIKKNFKYAKARQKEVFKEIEKSSGVDLYATFEDMLDNNNAISNIKHQKIWNNLWLLEGFDNFDDPNTFVFTKTTFKISNIGDVEMISALTNKSMSGFSSSKFLGIASFAINGKEVSEPNLYVAKYLYGLSNEDVRKLYNLTEEIKM